MTVAKHYSLQKPPAAKEPSWFLVVLLSGVLSGMLLFTIGWYLSLSQTQRDLVMNKIVSAGDIFPGIVGLNRPKVLLVMGVDMPPKGSKTDYTMVRTDTMMLARLDPGENKVNIVSIPRDSKVYVSGGHGVNKINAAFTLGGPEVAVATVEETLGVDIDNYLVLNIRGVREVIDALGGIDIYIEKPMRYRDQTAGLNINLQQGFTHLDGKQAEGFLRFRHDALADIGRIRRQQQFITAVATKLKDPSVLLKIKPLIAASSKYVMTDMSTQELIRLALFGKDLKSSSVEVATLPGHPSLNSYVSYWIIDPEPAEDVLNRMIVGVRDDSDGYSSTETPTVGILYTSTHQQDVQAYASQLESEGFQVLCKLQLRRSATKVITHSAHQSKHVERRLQQSSPTLEDAQLIFSPHGATFETNSCGRSDFTVILGDDTRSARDL